jgi:hypothetical protein
MARHAVAAAQDTLPNELFRTPEGTAGDMVDHAVPSHSAAIGFEYPSQPTAMHALTEMQETPPYESIRVEAACSGSIVHVEPFHQADNGRYSMWFHTWPTAMHPSGAAQLTSSKYVWSVPCEGTKSCVHSEPFHR